MEYPVTYFQKLLQFIDYFTAHFEMNKKPKWTVLLYNLFQQIVLLFRFDFDFLFCLFP